jgi:hypothetical protein
MDSGADANPAIQLEDYLFYQSGMSYFVLLKLVKRLEQGVPIQVIR